MGATVCAVLSLEVLQFSGDSLLCWWIPSPAMIAV